MRRATWTLAVAGLVAVCWMAGERTSRGVASRAASAGEPERTAPPRRAVAAGARTRVPAPAGRPRAAAAKPSGTRRPGDPVPFNHLVAHRPRGLLHVEVVDAETRGRLQSCTYRWEQPGTAPAAGAFADGAGVVQVRTGIAGNLRVERDGYLPGGIRQVRLTGAQRQRRVVVALERRGT